ncbi:phage portal protein [Escherichia coli]
MAKVADGIRYAERVVAGEIVAGEFVRLACQRFLDDLKYGEERGIYFSEPRAQHILNFYKFVPHVKGALAGQPIELMDWHVFILINIFGFVIPLVNEETGEVVMRSDGSGRPVMVRRFRTAYNEVARKNAKSTLSSGIGLYMTGADGEGGAEVYSAATTRDQARIVFEDAKNMVRKARSTLGRLFDFNKLAIYQEQSASKFEPLSSDANNLDGLNIHCAIIDELHAHKTRDVWDVLETATGARLQSLLFGITTAGFNKEGICYEQRDYAIKVLRGYNSDVEGAVKDDSYFAIIYTLDEGDDPFDETVWQKANPGLGICKRWDDLRRLAKKAKEQVSARVNFFTKHMNVWVTAESAWMDMIKWEKCEYIAPRHELKTYPMWVGVDLAHKIDICAAAKLWRTDNGHVHADFKFWLPEGRLERCSRQQAELYRKWAEMDKLILTDGDVIDHAQIKSDLLEWIGGENLRELGFDPWSAMQFSLALAEEGIPLVEVPQTVRNLSEAMKETESLVYAGRFHHSNHPVMNWMIPKLNSSWEPVYQVTFPDGSTDVLSQEDIWHVRTLTLDGLVGLNPIAYAREAISLAAATEEHGARLFSNGAVTSGVLRTEQTLSDQAYERLKKDFEERHTGLGNAHRPMILEMGLDWKSMALNAEDSQFLETRKFQLEEICRLFRVPLHMVQNTDRATFNNIEELGLGFINYSLVPYLTRIEQRINTGLVRKSKQGVYYAKFNAGALLRGDMKSRFEAYATGINWGIYSPNDCRDLEDMNPRPGGDVYLTPMNMTTKPSDGSKAGKQKDNANADETTS